MKLEDLETNVTNSGSDRSGSIGEGSGSASGSGTNGSVGNVDGSDRGIDGNDRGTTDGSAVSAGSGSGSVDVESNPNDANANAGNVDGNQNVTNLRSSRAERERGRRSIRLGADGNRDTGDRSSTDGAGNGETVDSENVGRPVIRLGARGQGEPRKVGAATSSKKSKLSEVKGYVKIFVESVFDIPAIGLKQDFWRLSPEESKQLTEAIIDYLESMPDSEQSRFAEFMGKHLPIINLAMVGFFIVSERVRQSVAIYQVTKSGNAFAQAVNSHVPVENTSGVKTPMDSMFNN